MSYIDRSTYYTLDQFLSFLDMNIMGSNDKHLVDHFSVDHNWNASSADGTHKADSILGSYISKNSLLDTSYIVPPSTTWNPTSGVYNFSANIGSNNFFEQRFSGSWEAALFRAILFCDGTNLRFVNNDVLISWTIYYLKY